MDSGTCIEFTPAPLSPAWMSVLTTAGSGVPNYLAQRMAAGQRAHAFVVSSDAERTVLVFPESPSTTTIPTNACLDVNTLVMESSSGGDRHVARPLADPGTRLEVRGAGGDMLDAKVALVDAETVQAMAKGFGPA